jgi:pimeloyl-ACP methyl ester carboxylesterase
MTVTAPPTQHQTTIAGLSLSLDQAGSGDQVVVVHHSTGPLWSPFLDRLSATCQVLALHLPGYGRSQRPAAARSPRDLAILSLQWLDALDVAGVDVVGLGFGGWVAAEMATMNQRLFRTLTVVGAAGLKPAEGFIHDPMLGSFEDYVRFGFSDQRRFNGLFGDEIDPAVIELWDFSREMTARLTWKQWMWSTSLPGLLPGVATPALVVWGDDDRIVPLDCGERYASLLMDARLCVVPDAGHNVDLERPDELTHLVRDFLSTRER